VELAQRLSASSEGMSATVATHPGIRLTTVQGFVQTRTGQGNLSLQKSGSKSDLTSVSFIHPNPEYLKQNNLLNFVAIA